MFHAEEIFPRRDLGGMSHGSTIAEGPDETLYVVWYAGTWEKEADVKIFISKKPKSGTWSVPVLVEKEGITSENPFLDEAEDEQELQELKNEETSEGNPVIFCDSEQNRLWLFWETMRGAGEKSGWSMSILKMKHSDDWGKTWVAPRILRRDIGWGTRNKPIWMSNGELILPISIFGTSFYHWSKAELAKGSQDCSIQEPEAYILGKYSQPCVTETKKGLLY
jgi:alpha-L-rhamnosidase